MDADGECPVCELKIAQEKLEAHVNICLFLREAGQSPGPSTSKRKNFSIFHESGQSKRIRQDVAKVEVIDCESDGEDRPRENGDGAKRKLPEKDEKSSGSTSNIPLAERMRPETLENFIGQTHILNKNAILRQVLEKHEIPSMILWGPPGCGKVSLESSERSSINSPFNPFQTSLAHVIASRCKTTQNSRFVKLSATMSGVNDVKQAVNVAKNELRFKRKTILFLDEIHRFNKLQQDIFLPHVEAGTITLIGATTENPSFSLNSALLSRCRVIILEKIPPEDMLQILSRAVKEEQGEVRDFSKSATEDVPIGDAFPRFAIDLESLKWLSDICDGDARIGLNSLQLALQSIPGDDDKEKQFKTITLKDIQEGIQKSHILYDRKGDQHYDMISALHKSIRASDDSASLYWCTRMIVGGEDPRFICRRLVRAASEDIGLADPNAVQVALSALQAVQLVGMPESDCIITQCAVYLARAKKSRETYLATNACRQDIENCKGLLPPVPLHLRNAPTKLMKEMGCAKGYNTGHKDVSGLTYMPEGMEDKDYFAQ